MKERNLRTDIGERTNVIGQHADRARQLQALLAQWQTVVDGEGKDAAQRATR